MEYPIVEDNERNQGIFLIMNLLLTFFIAGYLIRWIFLSVSADANEIALFVLLCVLDGLFFIATISAGRRIEIYEDKLNLIWRGKTSEIKYEEISHYTFAEFKMGKSYLFDLYANDTKYSLYIDHKDELIELLKNAGIPKKKQDPENTLK